MEVIKLTPVNQAQTLKLAVEYLSAGKVIAYPTETVYGLGCDATDAKAIAKIYRIKGKSEKRALLFLVSSLAMAKKYLVFKQPALALVKKYWPGALSIILPLTVEGMKNFKRKDGGVRVSSNLFATGLVRKFGKPIVSTSANPTNQPAPQTAEEVIEYFKDQKLRPDLILDGGKLKKSKGSTIVSLLNNETDILRQGDVKII